MCCVVLSGAWPRTSRAQSSADKEYLRAVLPPALERYAGVEVPAAENIRAVSDNEGRYLEFRLIPGQAKKNNGIRSEISVNYPYREGDVVRYRWKMRLPSDFQPDPQNRWWVMGQWHDQPDKSKGETWDKFPANSPPVSFNYRHVDGRDVLALMVGSPKMTSRGLVPLTRDRWHSLDVIIKWSQGADGKVVVYLDKAEKPVVAGDGSNMHNGFHHYLKLGMYRHPQISTDNRLAIRDVSIETLKDWPEKRRN